MEQRLRYRLGWLIGLGSLLLVLAAVGVTLRRRPAPPPREAGGNLLVNPGFQRDANGDDRPDGWEAGPAAELSDWTITPDPGGHSLRLTGSNSYVRSSPLLAWPGQTYTFSGQALTDAAYPGRLQVVFLWEDTRREVFFRQSSPWLEVPAREWRQVVVAFAAPEGAAGLSLLLRPAGDAPLYLDDLRLAEAGVRLEPFPDYARAALAVTLDWETAMGGLIHSRSDDGYDPTTAEERGLAMRRGTENLLNLFRRYDIRATWYAAGYSLLAGNTEGRTFAAPVYSWASAANGWRDDRWTTTPWFADDPHGDAASHPAWYFGDLLPRLVEAGQEVQSHTFGHLYLGLASPEELRADLRWWNRVAGEAGLPPARSLAFPWGASLGMSDASYGLLEDLGYLAVTRTYHAPQGRSQYWVLPPDDLFHLRTVPGHPDLWAVPDHYVPALGLEEIEAIVDQVLLVRGVTTLWAHTEEVVSPEQVALWEGWLAYADDRRTDGLWIAPLTEIVQFRRDLEQVRVRVRTLGQDWEVVVRNGNDHTTAGLTLTLPRPVETAFLDDAPYNDLRLNQVRLPRLEAGREVRLRLSLGTWEEQP